MPDSSGREGERYRQEIAPGLALARSVSDLVVAAMITGASWRERLLGLYLAMGWAIGERAGKLGIAFVRARNFSTNELFTLAELELPSPGMDVRETLRTNSSFGQIEIAFIAHNSRSGEGINVSVFNDQRLRRDLEESDARWFEMLAATDDRGRSYSFSSAVHSYGYSVFHVKVPSDAKKLVLTVAAPRILFVEYTTGREDITRPK